MDITCPRCGSKRVARYSDGASVCSACGAEFRVSYQKVGGRTSISTHYSSNASARRTSSTTTRRTSTSSSTSSQKSTPVKCGKCGKLMHAPRRRPLKLACSCGAIIMLQR